MKNCLNKCLGTIPLIVFLFLFSCGPEYTYLRRGIAYYNDSQYDQAISDFTKALEINPRDADAYSNRGSVYREKGQYEQAISDSNKALEINPNFGMAYYQRGRVYYLKGEYNKSWNDIKKTQDLGFEIPSEFLDELRKASGRQN
jgi:tetratricopeptide (TPR) repeat protein